MKKLIFSCLALMLGASAYAQSEPDNAVVLDMAEDTTQVTTIADIIEVQEMVTSRNSTVSHFSKVWGRNTYFNMAYANTSLTPKEDISLGYNDKFVPEFKSDWGASIQLGHSYGLHKKPIANVAKFHIDYTYIDLNVNHFKVEEGEHLYNSAATWESKGTDSKVTEYHYIPWCLEKYEANYSMALGPSLTIAPFTYIRVPQLHFMKINVFYHIGYQVSMLWMQNDNGKDANPSAGDNNEVNKALKLNWGHGLTTSFGVSLSWKSIGVGYEVRSGELEYQSIQKDIFGKDKYKFDAKTSRIYLTIRY